MVALLRRNLGQQPPTGPVSVDWGHPLAQGLQSAWVMSEGAGLTLIDAAGGNDARVTGTASWHPRGWGGGAQQAVPRRRIMLAMTRLSVVAQFTRTGTNAGSHLIGHHPDWWLRESLSGGVLNFLVNNGDGGVATTSTPGLGKPAQVAGVYDGSGLRISFDGRLEGSAAYSTATGTGGALELGGYWNSASHRYPALYHAFYLYPHHVLTQDRVAWLAAEPYAMLTQGPMRSVFWVGSGATAAPFRPQVILAA
jgi:hypothetical protein